MISLPAYRGRSGATAVLIEMAYWGARHDATTAPPKSFARDYDKDRAGLLAAIKAGSDPSNN
jgi:hypothetical protein